MFEKSLFKQTDGSDRVWTIAPTTLDSCVPCAVIWGTNLPLRMPRKQLTRARGVLDLAYCTATFGAFTRVLQDLINQK